MTVFKVLGQVKKYKCQLVKADVPQLEFRVWRVECEESDIEVADDESESSDSDDACIVEKGKDIKESNQMKSSIFQHIIVVMMKKSLATMSSPWVGLSLVSPAIGHAPH
jgi:hypothetical protein